MMNKADWVWMPHVGHLIVGRDCRFYLCTCVGDWIVSTVGEWLPDSQVREILAQSRGITIVGKGDAREADWMQKCGYEEVGCGRKYETMVFPAKRMTDRECCPFGPADWSERDSDGYNDPGAAYLGHLAMCEKWAEQPREVPA